MDDFHHKCARHEFKCKDVAANVSAVDDNGSPSVWMSSSQEHNLRGIKAIIDKVDQ